MPTNAEPTEPEREQAPELLGEGRAAERSLSVPLPPGRLVRGDEGTGKPVLWMPDEPTSADTWAWMYADHRRPGL
ncbi:hypothetical protein OG417_44375 [Actinoallomurus sp. NBC_01490]|uniref:hypothetical protein n=1 Tax=Actinoallomurus sp. NBC_01490 TaxID=2903557 RepID=UPI002E34AA41|nr:hypothetical protein [Actinoallomurus sp. NBC_01490]